MDIIYAFKEHYKLTRSIREIDWFLWLYGKEFLSVENKEELKTPTDELIDKYAEKAKTIPRYALGDKALSKLKRDCSSSTNFEDVWLKVIVINYLYGAGVIDTFKMAQHIHRNSDSVDKKLSSGDHGLVDDIRQGHGIRRKNKKTGKEGKEIDFYSFATKYCSEHKPSVFPIFDSKVRGMLFKYKERDGFATFI